MNTGLFRVLGGVNGEGNLVLKFLSLTCLPSLRSVLSTHICIMMMMMMVIIIIKINISKGRS